MRSSASQALHFATWGAEHGVTTAQLDRFRRALDSGERELDLSAIAVRAVPSFLRGEHMLHCLTLRFAADEYLHVDVELLPRLRTLRIVRSNVRKLLISGKGELRVQQGARCELEVSDSTTLQEMKMRTNAFDTLHIRDLRRLCELDVSASRLRHLAVVNAPELERLDASMNPLHDRGLELSEVGRLARIRLALGRLERIPPAVLQAPALRELDLRGNRIAIVAPADLPRLLVSLNLSCNALLAVPGDVACQASLRDLRLEMNRIASLPDTIGAFRRLETLDLSHNCIRALPPTIGRCNLLRVLKLGANQLSWLPSEVCQLAALETLHLDHNALTALPEDIHRLARLASLQLQGNALASLPGRLDELPVRRLILSGNPFFSVPELLLRKLTCSGQPSFAALAALDLGDTRLSEVPEGLGFRSTLVQLRLRGNPGLRNLPDDLSNLHRLRWLDLSGCGFRRIVPSLQRMSSGVKVFLYRNPLGGGFASEARARICEPQVPWCVTQEVRSWRALLSRDLTREQEACWNERLPFRNSDAFAYLLAGLRVLPEYLQSSSAGQTRFWFGVNRLLVDIEENHGLSGYIFDEAEMNTAILADRHRLSFDRLALTARLHVLAENMGAGDQVAALLMCEAYRRESVAALAAQEARASRERTEVELDLAYRIRLSRESDGFLFGYDAQLDEMCPRLDDVHVRNVIAMIRIDEQRELVDYMCEAPVWRRYLMRTRALAYLIIIAGFDARIEACFNECLPGDAEGEERLARTRLALLAEREQAVLAWLRDETIALMTDNPLLIERA